MYPVYGCMPYFPQFYPQNQFPQAVCRNYPFWGVVPPAVNTDTVKAPSSFVPESNNAHPNQSELSPYHSHNCYPGYHVYIPSHPQSQPWPMYFCGTCPHHPNVFPSYYTPSAGYFPEQHGGSAFGKSHRCGCPNHKFLKQDSNCVSERKDQKSSGQKLDDCHSYNPYPMLCIPRGNSNDADHDIPNLNFMPPSSCKGLMPVDGSELDGEVGMKDRKQYEGRMERNFPIIWLPSNYRSEEAEKAVKEMQPSPKIEEVPSCNVKIIPVKQFDHGNPDDNGAKVQQDSEEHDDPTHSKIMNKSKIIPVQHVRSTEENHVSVTGEQVNEEVKLKNNERENGNVKNTFSPQLRRKLTPVKSSKLPPICLRVDPLPKNKKANGSSGVSSQVGQMKGGGDKTEKQGFGKDISENLEKKMEVIGDEVNGNNQDLQSLVHDADDSLSEIPEMSKMATNSELRGVPNPLLDAAESSDNMKQIDMSCNFAKVDQMKGKKSDLSLGQDNEKHLSETDAAIIIQSTYRGFEVRKWQPLKKLKQIRAVHDKAAGIKDKINSLESMSREQLESKTKIFLSEAIMGLLLESDTIQGLNPEVREIRKSVAQELVLLQERLDKLKKTLRTTDEQSSDCGREQANDLQITEVAVENLPGIQFLKENAVTCSDQGDSKQLGHDYFIGKEDRSLPEKEFVVDSEISRKVPRHLAGGCADASVEEHHSMDECVDETSRVPLTDETIASPTEPDLLVSSLTTSSQCSAEVNDDVSLVEKGSMGSGTKEAFGSLQEGAKESCTKDLGCFPGVVHGDSAVRNDITVNAKPDVVPEPDEVLSCLAVSLNPDNRSEGIEKVEDKKGVNVSLETADLQMTVQGDPLVCEPNGVSDECYHLEQHPLIMSPEQGKQVQAEEPKRSLGCLDRELEPAKEEENSRQKLDVGDDLLFRDDANCSERKEPEEQQLPCGDLTEAKKIGALHGMMKSDHVSDNGQMIQDKDNALAADTSTAAAITGAVNMANTGEDIPMDDSSIVVGPSEATFREIPSESCLPSEAVQSENHECSNVRASLFWEEHSEEPNKWPEQDEGLRTMLHKFLEAGQKQMQVISELSGRVNRLERRLSQKRRLRLKRKGLAGAAVCPATVKSVAYVYNCNVYGIL